MAAIFTQNGYMLVDVISALQKEIRRGNEEEAMYWALELLPRYEAYLWKRLTVIANEDIGIANIQVLLLLPSQAAVYMGFREEGKDGSARLVLANTILDMCRSEKSRIADEFQCTVLQEKIHSEKKELPDYALDKHTGKGKRMGRGFEHWLTEGCLLDNPSKLVNPYGESAATWWSSPKFVKVEWGKRSKKCEPIQSSLFDAFVDKDDEPVVE